MSEPTPPPRRPLATFLRASSEPAPAADPSVPDAVEGLPLARPDVDDQDRVSVFDPPPGERDDEHGETIAPTPTEPSSPAPGGDDDAIPAGGMRSPTADDALRGTGAAPSFLRLPGARLRTPRWQWGLVAGLVALLLLQIAVADRARLAADAGSRPWIAGLCGVLRCSLPAWQEPAAFSMISRDVRPVPGQAGALQVQASFRNDARWAQPWPSLRLSLSDADGRVIGTGVFAPRHYLDPTMKTESVLEPGQSAQIAFRVREPAASTVAFTFEFL